MPPGHRPILPRPERPYCNPLRSIRHPRFHSPPGKPLPAATITRLKPAPTPSLPLPTIPAHGIETAERWLRAAVAPVASLYIHVPFCFHKCHYCDFYSFVDSQDRQAAFADALIRELDAQSRCLSRDGGLPTLETIFVGGGTPSLLRVDLWQRLLDALHASFILGPGAEFTVECNPETVTPELIRTFAQGGVNRVSIGAQSFDPAHLKTLERWHDPASVARALRIAAEGGITRRNIDLIFAIPGQTIDDWRTDLHRALSLDPGVEHVSCYALTYEPNTPITARLNRREFRPVDDETETAMYLLAADALASAGFERYEISNFARPGAECRHNLAYWRNRQWLAAGPSASAHLGGARWKNIPRLTDWIEGVHRTQGFAPVVDLEEPDPNRELAEVLMMGLRTNEGVSKAEVADRDAACRTSDRLHRSLLKLIDAGSLTETQERWRLTTRGSLIADAIAAELIAAIRRA